MQVKGLNHINIVAADLDRTVEFYETVLGMKAQEIPMAPAGFTGRWINDHAGSPIIHVQNHNTERHGPMTGDRDTTGSIDHVALTCSGFSAMIKRCEDMGIDFQVNDRQFGDLRQVFVNDPDNIRLELNFPEG